MGILYWKGLLDPYIVSSLALAYTLTELLVGGTEVVMESRIRIAKRGTRAYAIARITASSVTYTLLPVAILSYLILMYCVYTGHTAIAWVLLVIVVAASLWIRGVLGSIISRLGVFRPVNLSILVVPASILFFIYSDTGYIMDKAILAISTGYLSSTVILVASSARLDLLSKRYYRWLRIGKLDNATILSSSKYLLSAILTVITHLQIIILLVIIYDLVMRTASIVASRKLYWLLFSTIPLVIVLPSMNPLLITVGLILLLSGVLGVGFLPPLRNALSL
ncbi:MAG: hypothetical protein F7B78_02290 [Desulfurococcales archaeon]|nr:hypothetical protein [Desulfurococcales archaeon]